MRLYNVTMNARWVGRSLVAVGVIHCLFGVVVFSSPLLAILEDGIWNSVDGHPVRPLAFWFEVVGIVTILFGVAVDALEKDRNTFPAFLGYGFGLLTVLAIVAMPAGGGWLLVPSAAGLLLKRVR